MQANGIETGCVFVEWRYSLSITWKCKYCENNIRIVAICEKDRKVGHSKRSTVTIESATFDTDVLAVQNGTEVYQGSTEITKYEAFQVTDASNIATKFKAIGEAGAEIGYVYKLDNSGTIIAQFIQTAAPAANGDFSYSSETKALTFFESDPDKPVVGDTLAMVYTFMSADNAKRVDINADGIPPTVMLTLDGFVKDTCTGQLFPCQLEGMAQVDGWALL